jgi:hypothetical protein
MKRYCLLTISFWFISSYTFSQKKITPDEAINNIGETVTICDKIVDARYLESSPGKFTLLNMGGRFPNQKVTIVINQINRNNFPLRPEVLYLNKTLCVSGKLSLYKQKPQIQISNPGDISVNDASEIVSTPATATAPNTQVPTIDNKRKSGPSALIRPPLIYTSNVTYEVGLSVGTMNAATDVGRKKSSIFLPSTVDWKSTKGNVSIYAGILFKNIVGARLEMTYGRVAGSDENGLYTDRNLSYRSKIFEIAAIGEYFPLRDRKLLPYAMAGIGVFSFNPQAKYKNDWVDLKPLHTEGEGFSEYADRPEYSLTGVCLPFGLGVRYELSNMMNFRLEGLYRYTFTDYLDDVSRTYIDPALFTKYLSASEAAMAAALSKSNVQAPLAHARGGVKTKDKYFTINIKLGVKLFKH